MAANRADERGLVDSHNAGDPDAFGCIVRAHYAALLGHALRRLNDRHAAEDAVQEALLRAYLALPRFNGAYHLSAWLHRILDNVCIDEGNRRRRECAADERAGVMLADVEPDVATQLHVPDPLLSQALASLPERQAEAFVLRHIHDLSYRDVAIKTGVSEENARARVHRARLALRRAIVAAGLPLAWLARSVRRSQPAMAEALHAPGERAAAFVAGLPPVVPPVAAADHLGLMSKVATAIVAVAVPVATAGGIQASIPAHDHPAGSAGLHAATARSVGTGAARSTGERVRDGAPGSFPALAVGRGHGEAGSGAAGATAGDQGRASGGDDRPDAPGAGASGGPGESSTEAAGGDPSFKSSSASSPSGGADTPSDGSVPNQPRVAPGSHHADPRVVDAGGWLPLGAPGGGVSDKVGAEEPVVIGDDLRSQARGVRQRLTGDAHLVSRPGDRGVPGAIVATLLSGDAAGEPGAAPERLVATFRTGAARTARRTEVRFSGLRTEAPPEVAGEGIVAVFTGTYTVRNGDIAGVDRAGRFSAVYRAPLGERGRTSLTIVLFAPAKGRGEASTPVVENTSPGQGSEPAVSAVAPPPAPAPSPPASDTGALSSTEPPSAEPAEAAGEPTVTAAAGDEQQPAQPSSTGAEQS